MLACGALPRNMNTSEETMPNTKAIRIAVEALSSRNWITFAELESETGLSRDQILEIKPDIEAGLRQGDPSARLVSRIDLHPEGFEVGE